MRKQFKKAMFLPTKSKLSDTTNDNQDNIQDTIKEEEKGLITLDIDKQTIYIDGFIENDSDLMFEGCINALLESETFTNKIINIEINSTGGSVNGTMLICEQIEQLKENGYTVNTYSREFCMSGAFIIFIHGTNRYARRYTNFMCHNANMEMDSGVITKDVLNQFEKRIDTYWISLEHVLKEKTKFTHKQLKEMKDIGNDLYLNCNEAIKYGIADKII